MSDELVMVLSAQGDLEAESVCAFLADNGIAATYRSEAERRAHQAALDEPGAVGVLVARPDADAAHALLRQVEAGDLRLGDEDES